MLLEQWSHIISPGLEILANPFTRLLRWHLPSHNEQRLRRQSHVVAQFIDLVMERCDCGLPRLAILFLAKNGQETMACPFVRTDLQRCDTLAQEPLCLIVDTVANVGRRKALAG